MKYAYSLLPPPSPTASSTLALQKAITFQPMMETKVNFAIPDPLINVLVEPHKDLDPDLHLMDGITESYTINGCLLYTSPSPRDS